MPAGRKMLVATKSVQDNTVVVVVETTASVDRKDVAGWSIGKSGKASDKLADRLIRAIVAGKAITINGTKTDVNGNTYLSTTSRILGRTMNADLVRLGF